MVRDPSETEIKPFSGWDFQQCKKCAKKMVPDARYCVEPCNLQVIGKRWEHMHRICPVCEYEWLERPNDWKKEING